MNYEQIFSSVKDIIHNHTEIEMACDEVLIEHGIDSVSIIEIVMELEEMFNIEFDSSSLNYKLLKSMESISKYIYLAINGKEYE
jgi:acyl carrier protein